MKFFKQLFSNEPMSVKMKAAFGLNAMAIKNLTHQPHNSKKTCRLGCRVKNIYDLYLQESNAATTPVNPSAAEHSREK